MKSWCPLALLLLSALCGCRTFREVALDRIERDIDRGDLVRVTDNEDAQVMFRVTGVDDDAVRGEDIRFDVADIRTIEVEGYHALRGVGGVVELAIAFLTVSAAIAGTAVL